MNHLYNRNKDISWEYILKKSLCTGQSIWLHFIEVGCDYLFKILWQEITFGRTQHDTLKLKCAEFPVQPFAKTQ